MNISKRSNSAFTIIELLIVIVIIGILVAITAIAYTSITKQANSAATNVELSNVKKAVDIYFMKNGSIPENAQQMDEAGLSDFMKKAHFNTIANTTEGGSGPTINRGKYLITYEDNTLGGGYYDRYLSVYYWNEDEGAWYVNYFADTNNGSGEEYKSKNILPSALYNSDESYPCRANSLKDCKVIKFS